MDEKLILVFVFLVFAICSNLIIYFKLSKRDCNISDNSKLQAQVMIIDKKIEDIKQYMEELTYNLENISKGEVVEIDELYGYVKNNMNVNEIAKKMNKSVKEVELMLKMRGLA